MRIAQQLSWVLIAVGMLGGCSVKRQHEARHAGPPPLGTVKAILSLGTGQSRGLAGREGADPWHTLAAGAPLQPGAFLRTAPGSRGRIELVSGSLVLLNQRTALQLASASRLNVESGEVLAEVQPTGKERPLAIVTPACQIRVTGTKLNLQVSPKRSIVDVARGTVEVEAAGTQVQVGAGERATVEAGQRPRIGLSSDLVQVTRWSEELSVQPRAVTQIEPGFGSLTARVPGRGAARGLQLAKQRVRVTVLDNIARTEVEQVYYNPSSETLEGTYSFPLPAGSSIARLALEVGQQLVEGEIVERQRARQIFNKIVNDTIRPRDPALLEWIGGRIFRMKIFPIPPRATRRVILAYVEPLAASYGHYSYIYPMATSRGKATRVGQFAIEVQLAGSHGLTDVQAPLYPVLKTLNNNGVQLRYEASDFAPAASFVVNFQPAGAVPEVQLALYEKKQASPRCALGREQICGDRGGFLMALLRPELPATERATRKDYLFLLDSSYSTGPEGWAVQRAALEAFIAEMDLRSRINLMACDERCRVFDSTFRAPTVETRQAALGFLRGLTPGGSSNLQAAFAEAARVVQAAGRPVDLVYIGDGRATAGELREPELARLVVQGLSRANATLDVLLLGEDTGELFLQEATRQLGGTVHHLDAGDDIRRQVFAIIAAQYRPTLTNLELTFEGVEVHDVYPRRLSSLTAGSEAVVTARYDRPGEGALVLNGSVDGRPFVRRYPVALNATLAERQANSFIPRLWAKEHLDALSLENYAANRPEIVRVSQAYTVLSRATAFLVLENERMYQEFHVQRRAGAHRGELKAQASVTRALTDQPQATPPSTEVAAPSAPSSLGEQSQGAGPSAAADALADHAAAGSARPLPAAAPARRAAAAPREPSGKPEVASSAARSTRELDDEERIPAEAKAAPGPDAQDRLDPEAESAPQPSLLARPPGLLGRARLAPRPLPAPIVRIEPLIDFTITAMPSARLERVRRDLATHPERRSVHQLAHRLLVQQGNYFEAERHAREWANLDGSHPTALLALADMQAAFGRTDEAIRTASAAVEVQPWSIALHRSLAQMYRHKGELERSCAHLWSIVSLQPQQPAHQLALASCLAQLPAGATEAIQLLGELARAPLTGASAQGARLAQTLARLSRPHDAIEDERTASERGALVLKASWDRPLDLDLALVMPDGRRLSSLHADSENSIVLDSRDGRSAEVLSLRLIRDGSYRVELNVAKHALRRIEPVSGTLLVRVRGKSQVIPFVLSGPVKALARLELFEPRVPPGYYRR